MHVVLFQSGATCYIDKIHVKRICTHAYITHVLCILPKYPQEASFSAVLTGDSFTQPQSLYQLQTCPLLLDHLIWVDYIKMRKIITLSIISAVLEPRFKALRCWLQNLKRLHFPSTDSASLTSLPQWSQISDWTGARLWLEESRPLWRWTPLGLMPRCASWAHRAGSVGTCVSYQMKNTFPQEKSEITTSRGSHTSSWERPAGVVPPIGSAASCHYSIFQAWRATKLPYSKMTDCLMIVWTKSYLLRVPTHAKHCAAGGMHWRPCRLLETARNSVQLCSAAFDPGIGFMAINQFMKEL